MSTAVDRIALERKRLKHPAKQQRDAQTIESQQQKREDALARLRHPPKVECVTGFLQTEHGGEDDERIRGELNIRAKSMNDLITLPSPVASWDDPRLPKEVFAVYYEKHKHKMRSPTAIQAQLWPCMLTGKDALGVAPTGSGKTLAFALPLGVHAMANVKRDVDQPCASCLVLAPTRELVAQIAKVMRKFHRMFCGITVCAVYGGKGDEKATSEEDEATEVSKANIVVATPGRALDLILSEKLVVSAVSCVVLDEADRMLQMGLREDVETIVSCIPANRQTVLTSATWTADSIRVAQAWLNSDDHFEIFVGTVEGSDLMHLAGGKKAKQPQIAATKVGDDETVDPEATPEKTGGSLTIAKDITQIVHLCAEHKKPRKLIRHIENVRKDELQRGQKRNAGPMLIFCNKIKTVMFVYEFLARQNVRVVAIHGSMTQDRRERALTEFRAGKYICLVATDVAGRGLHIPNLVHVVNYDFPPNLAQYAHRVGRCGRGDKHGTAFSFFTRNLAVMAPDLVSLLKASGQQIDPNLKNLAEEFANGGRLAVPDVDEDGEAVQDDTELLRTDIDGRDDGAPASDTPTGAVGDISSEKIRYDDEGSVPYDVDEVGSDFDEQDEGYIEDSRLDNIGAVPLKSFVPLFALKANGGKKPLKRPRGNRGGKKSKKRARSE